MNLEKEGEAIRKLMDRADSAELNMQNWRYEAAERICKLTDGVSGPPMSLTAVAKLVGKSRRTIERYESVWRATGHLAPSKRPPFTRLADDHDERRGSEVRNTPSAKAAAIQKWFSEPEVAEKVLADHRTRNVVSEAAFNARQREAQERARANRPEQPAHNPDERQVRSGGVISNLNSMAGTLGLFDAVHVARQKLRAGLKEWDRNAHGVVLSDDARTVILDEIALLMTDLTMFKAAVENQISDDDLVKLLQGE